MAEGTVEVVPLTPADLKPFQDQIAALADQVKAMGAGLQELEAKVNALAPAADAAEHPIHTAFHELAADFEAFVEKVKSRAPGAWNL